MGKPALWRQLDAGPVEIALSVDTSGVGLRDGADRNVDVLMLTQNTSDWERRLSDETTNLPGDGLLSQVGLDSPALAPVQNSPRMMLLVLPQSPPLRTETGTGGARGPRPRSAPAPFLAPEQP